MDDEGNPIGEEEDQEGTERRQNGTRLEQIDMEAEWSGECWLEIGKLCAGAQVEKYIAHEIAA